MARARLVLAVAAQPVRVARLLVRIEALSLPLRLEVRAVPVLP